LTFPTEIHRNFENNLNGINLSCEDEVKLLGVTIDFKPNFNTHISNICKKAARQLNVLKRIGKHSENHLIRELLSSSKAEITFSKVVSDFDKVLSSA
jgi:polyribonucleotide nucleotidyltransferase